MCLPRFQGPGMLLSFSLRQKSKKASNTVYGSCAKGCSIDKAAVMPEEAEIAFMETDHSSVQAACT